MIPWKRWKVLLNLSVSRVALKFDSSMTSSWGENCNSNLQFEGWGKANECWTWSQRVARLPTVVSCAGWRWVKPRQGTPACSWCIKLYPVCQPLVSFTFNFHKKIGMWAPLRRQPALRWLLLTLASASPIRPWVQVMQKVVIVTRMIMVITTITWVRWGQRCPQHSRKLLRGEWWGRPEDRQPQRCAHAPSHRGEPTSTWLGSKGVHCTMCTLYSRILL